MGITHRIKIASNHLYGEAMTARETAALKRRIRLLERDRMQARSLLLPNQVAVYKAALKWAEDRIPADGAMCPCIACKLVRACARARKGTK